MKEKELVLNVLKRLLDCLNLDPMTKWVVMRYVKKNIDDATARKLIEVIKDEYERFELAERRRKLIETARKLKGRI